MRKFLLMSAAVLALAACAPKTSAPDVIVDGFTKVESVSAKGGEIAIPYNKYVLDNGLTVILHTDTSDPLVHVDVTYHVGSGREQAGRSGFAHFFEHMQFQGSENVADEQHFGLITESGGTANGSTNTDRTHYYETVPSNQLERMLWLEADRMGFFLDAVTQKKFEVQRETVKNERGQRLDNRPYGLLYERINEALYPEGHPYSWQVIGYIEDINRANLNDLKRFFLRWYGPNNAALSIGGDIDEAQTLEWVKKYFGGIPRGPKVEPPTYTQVTLEEDRYISMEDNVSKSLLYMSWPTVRVYHEDEAPLDVLMDIIGSGKTSLLYKNLVKQSKASSAWAGHGCSELGCTFTIGVFPTPENSLSDIEKIARDSLAEFEERGGANDDDIQRVKAGIVSGMIYGLESVSGKVSRMARYQYMRGNPDYIKKDVARYESVTKDDVMRVYKKYIKDKHAVVMSIVPKGQPEAIIKPDTWSMYARNIPASTEGEGIVLRPGTSDFDRSVIPTAGANPTIKIPDVYTAKTANGIAITGAINSEVPTTTIRLTVPAGQTRESVDQLGLAQLTMKMLKETTMRYSAEELSNELNKLGSSVNLGAGDKFVTMNIRTLTKNLSKTLEIALEKLTEPKFTQDDFDRVQKQAIEAIKSAKKDASYTATTVFTELLFGSNNSFARANSGTIETVSALTLDDVKAFYKAAYGPQGSKILVVSDLPRNQIARKLNIFGEWQGGHMAQPALKPFPDLETGTLYFIDKPDAAQSEIRIGKRGPNFDATGEFYRNELMNYNLGGAFNSRINLNLREDKGYTYGAHSFFYANDMRGAYRAQAGVRANTTTDSIRQFVNEITSFQEDGMTDKELAFMKASLGQQDARSYETPRQKLGYLSEIALYGLSPDYVDTQNEILQGITKDELNALAAKHLRMSEMIGVVVGDKAVVMEDLLTLGYPIVEIDTDGNVVGD